MILADAFVEYTSPHEVKIDEIIIESRFVGLRTDRLIGCKDTIVMSLSSTCGKVEPLRLLRPKRHIAKIFEDYIVESSGVINSVEM